MLVFVVLAFGTNGSADGVNIAKSGLAALGALPVALLVWSIGMSLGGTTGYAINPARDLGPRIIHPILPVPGKGASDWGYSWVPVVGPIVGGIVAALFYNVVWVKVMTPAAWGCSDTLLTNGSLAAGVPSGSRRRALHLNGESS